MKKLSLAVIGLMMSAALIVGCSSGPSPKDTVEDFTSAVSDLNMEAALECCDSSTNSMISGMLGLTDGLLSAFGVDLGMGTQELLEAFLPMVLDLNTAMDGQEYDLSIRARDLEVVEETDTTAVVTGVWEVEMVSAGNSQVEEGPVTFNLVKEGDEWRIDFSDELSAAIASSF